MMRCLILWVLAAVALTVASGKEEEHAFTREEAAACLMMYVDGLRVTYDYHKIAHCVLDELEQDHCVDIEEVRAAKACYLTQAEQVAAWIVKSDDQIMRDCDLDANGCISYNDMVGANQTCLNGNTLHKPRLEWYKQYICARAKAKLDKLLKKGGD